MAQNPPNESLQPTAQPPRGFASAKVRRWVDRNDASDWVLLSQRFCRSFNPRRLAADRNASTRGLRLSGREIRRSSGAL